MPGPLSDRALSERPTRNTLSSGMLNNTIFISKIFSQKIWPKNWGGSSNRKFREWFVCGSGPAPPRPPFVQMKNTPGGPSRGADFQPRHSARAIDHWVGRSAVYPFMPGSATFSPHLTARLPVYDAIAGVEAWTAAFGGLQNGHFWRLCIIMFPAGRRAGPGGGFSYQPESNAAMWVHLWVGVGKRRILLVISIVARGVLIRRRRETPDLLCDKSRRWPGRWRARVLEGKLWHPRFLKTFARIGAALGLPAVWMASLRQN